MTLVYNTTNTQNRIVTSLMVMGMEQPLARKTMERILDDLEQHGFVVVSRSAVVSDENHDGACEDEPVNTKYLSQHGVSE